MAEPLPTQMSEKEINPATIDVIHSLPATIDVILQPIDATIYIVQCLCLQQ